MLEGRSQDFDENPDDRCHGAVPAYSLQRIRRRTDVEGHLQSPSLLPSIIAARHISC